MIRVHVSFHDTYENAYSELQNIIIFEDGLPDTRVYQIRRRSNNFEIVERIEGSGIADKPNEMRRKQRARKRSKNTQSENRRNRGSVSNPE